MSGEDDGRMHRVTVTLPQDLVDALHDMSEDMRVSVSEAVREALNYYLLTDRWKTVGALAEHEIKAGRSNEQVLAAVRRKFPGASTSLGSISWYRSRLRRDNPTIPTDRQARVVRRRH
jgi:Arc/MetJ-type ribon-helix-helix transcriptional regulator